MHLEIPHYLDKAFASTKNAPELLVCHTKEGQRHPILVVIDVFKRNVGVEHVLIVL